MNRPRRFLPVATLAAICLLARTPLTTGAAQLPPPAGAIQGVVEDNSAPDWIALPAYGQVELPPGLKLEPISSVVIARDSPRAAALVGAFRNRSGDLANASLSLHYVGPSGARLGIAVNEAGVSAVARDDLLPFKFPLVAASEFAEHATLYKLVLETDGPARYRSVSGARVEVKQTRRRGHGVVITGALHFDTPGAIDPAGIVLTLMLTDANGRILDVVTDRPFRSAQELPKRPAWPFEVRSSMPISKPVRNVKVWVSASP